MYRLLNFIVLVVLICVPEISSDEQETDLQSKFSDRTTDPTDSTFSKDSSSLKFGAQNANSKEMETFYQKISQQLRSLEENPPSTESASHSRSSVQSKSAATETKKTAKAPENIKFSESRSHSHSLLVPIKTKDSKTNARLSHRNHFRPVWPATRDLPRIGNTAKPADGTLGHVHPSNRLRRDTRVGRRLPQKGGLREKTDDHRGNFHFRLILRKNSTARRPNPKLNKLKHPANFHVLRKRSATIEDVESAAAKQKRTDNDKKIYLERNEIVDEEFEDSLAKDKMWSSELAKDKLNFHERKFADASLFDESGFVGNNSQGGIENISQNGVHFASTSSANNVDQSNKERCGNPRIFSYRYYWCRVKNVFRNFIKLFKSK